MRFRSSQVDIATGGLVGVRQFPFLSYGSRLAPQDMIALGRGHCLLRDGKQLKITPNLPFNAFSNGL